MFRLVLFKENMRETYFRYLDLASKFDADHNSDYENVRIRELDKVLNLMMHFASEDLKPLFHQFLIEFFGKEFIKDYRSFGGERRLHCDLEDVYKEYHVLSVQYKAIFD
jgi:hypothetical protein